MACGCSNPSQNSGNTVSGIGIAPGAPLSTACERSSIVGSIPQIVKHPAFTLVAGGVVVNKASNGGIANMASFFKSRSGCYYDKNGQAASTCE